MRRWVAVALAVAVLVGVAVWPSAAAPGPLDGTPLCGEAGEGVAIDDGELRVATFNVLHSETDEGDASLGARLPLLAGAIAGSGADVVGLQEVTRNEPHGVVAQRLAGLVAERTGEPWSWCWSRSNPHVPGTPDIQEFEQDLRRQLGETAGS